MAASSPESDLGSIECFQNYTAPEVFVQGLAGQINQQDVEAIIRAQKQMLQRFEKTNEMLSNCNTLSASRFALAQKELKKHTTLLTDMKKDLDNIFKRIRVIKTKLATQYPAAYTAQSQILAEEDEDMDNRKIESRSKPSSDGTDEVAKMSVSEESNNGATSDPAVDNKHVNSMDIDDIPTKTHSSSDDSRSSSPKLSSSSSFDN